MPYYKWTAFSFSTALTVDSSSVWGNRCKFAVTFRLWVEGDMLRQSYLLKQWGWNTGRSRAFPSPGHARCPLACISVPGPLVFAFFYKVGMLGMGTYNVVYSVGLSKLLTTTVSTSATPSSLVGLCLLLARLRSGKARNPVSEQGGELPVTLIPAILYHLNNREKELHYITSILYRGV